MVKERERKSSLVDAPQLDSSSQEAHEARSRSSLSLFRRSNRNFELLLSSNNAHLLTQANKHFNSKKKKKVGKELKVLKNRKLKAKSARPIL